MDEAARAARRGFGNVTAATERFHESRRVGWLDELRQDVSRRGAQSRSLPHRRHRRRALAGAGIAAIAASLTIRDVFFQNPPPLYIEPQQLSQIQVNRQDRPIRPMGSHVPAGLFTRWQSALGPSIVAADVRDGVSDIRIGDRIEPTRVRAVTADLFDLLGVRRRSPSSGRSIWPGPRRSSR